LQLPGNVGFVQSPVSGEVAVVATPATVGVTEAAAAGGLM